MARPWPMEHSNSNRPITTTNAIHRARIYRLLQSQRVAEYVSNDARQPLQRTEKESDKSRGRWDDESLNLRRTSFGSRDERRE